MSNPIELQLFSLLSQNPEGIPTNRFYQAAERLTAELLGAQPESREARDMGVDVVLTRAASSPLAIEVKVFSGRFPSGYQNQASRLIAAAVQARRSFRDDVTLSAVLLVARTDTSPSGGVSERSLRWLLQRILRAEDGNGYDSVLIGFADDTLKWLYVNATEHSDFAPGSLQPIDTREAVNALLNQQTAPQRRRDREPRQQAQRYLLVADEWESGRGGISTVNRELAISLAAAGLDAAVLVPEVGENDSKSASQLGVKLVAPARIPGLSDRETLLLRPVFAEKDWEPDVIVGHGRLLGPYAFAQQQQFFPHARRVHFVHTDAEQLEAAKEELGGESRMVSADERRTLERDLARSADLVVGLGPLLAETIRDELIGPGPLSTVAELVPGLRKTFDVLQAQPPVKNRILIVGRADDFQSKGIDIAAEALLRIVDRWPDDRPHRPDLIVRGVPNGAADEVKAQLDAIFEGRVHYALRPYSSTEDEVVNDLAQARVLLLPSRHEGFGLAAYEAIASGVPVLVSSESGLAQFLRQSKLDTSPTSIVPTRDSATHLAIDRWADAIERVLDKPAAARIRAGELRDAIGAIIDWQKSSAALIREVNQLP